MPLPHFIGDLGRRAVALVGTSGCGKTTLLRIISEIERATGGKVTLRGNAVTGPGRWRRTGQASADDADAITPPLPEKRLPLVLLRQLWPQEASSARVGTTKRTITAAANRTKLLAPKTAVAPLKS